MHHCQSTTTNIQVLEKPEPNSQINKLIVPIFVILDLWISLYRIDLIAYRGFIHPTYFKTISYRNQIKTKYRGYEQKDYNNT